MPRFSYRSVVWLPPQPAGPTPTRPRQWICGSVRHRPIRATCGRWAPPPRSTSAVERPPKWQMSAIAWRRRVRLLSTWEWAPPPRSTAGVERPPGWRISTAARQATRRAFVRRTAVPFGAAVAPLDRAPAWIARGTRHRPAVGQRTDWGPPLDPTNAIPSAPEWTLLNRPRHRPQTSGSMRWAPRPETTDRPPAWTISSARRVSRRALGSFWVDVPTPTDRAPAWVQARTVRRHGTDGQIVRWEVPSAAVVAIGRVPAWIGHAALRRRLATRGSMQWQPVRQTVAGPSYDFITFADETLTPTMSFSAETLTPSLSVSSESLTSALSFSDETLEPI